MKKSRVTKASLQKNSFRKNLDLPLGVKVVAALYFFFALVCIITALPALLLSIQDRPFGFYNLFASLFWLAIGFFYFFIFLGLLKVRRWAFLAAIVFSVIGFFYYLGKVINVLSASGWQLATSFNVLLLRDIALMFLGILIFIYFVFGRGIFEMFRNGARK